jgi:hypothetical protein
MKKTHLHLLLAAAASAALLSACGGGNGTQAYVEPPAVTLGVPASALVSATAYTQYAVSLQTSETLTPIDLANVVTPPTSETDAPLAI